MAKRRGLGKTWQEIEAARRGQSGSFSRSDGLDYLVPIADEEMTEREQRLQSRLTSYATDPDFGVGYEVNDAPHNPASKRRRAEKIGYNRKLQYLAILMHNDGKGSVLIGYPDVTPEEWDQFQSFHSTTEFLDTVLYRFNNGNGWEKLDGLPPQTTEQSFEQGTID